MKIPVFRISGLFTLSLVSIVPKLLSAFLSLSILASSTLSGLATNFLSKVGIETTEAVLTRKNVDISQKNTQLRKKLDEGKIAAISARDREAALTRKNNALSQNNTRLTKKLDDGKEAIKLARKRVVNRASKSAIRNIASMPAEAIPVIGVGTIAVVTALELDDMCAIMGFVDDLTKTMSLDDYDASEIQGYCREWRDQLEKTSQTLKSTETSMRQGWESSQVTIGGTIYEACTSFDLCEEVGLPKQEPPSSQTPTRVPPSLHDEMVKQTTEYIEIVADLWPW